MRAGTAKVDITPSETVDLGGFRAREQPMTGVLDRLSVRSVAFDDESGGRAVVAVADNLAVPEEMVKAIRAEAQARFGLDPAQVHVAATHTHSAPCLAALRDCGRVDPAYARLFVERTVASIGAALEDLRPARLGVSRASVNLAQDRRLTRAVKERRGPQLDPEALTLWLYRRGAGRPFAAVVNYACHGVVMSGRLVSADWPGAACRALEAEQGGDFAAAVMPGAGANLNPAERGEAGALDRMGRALARTVAEAPVEEVAAGPVRTRTAGYRLRFLLPEERQLEADVKLLEEGAASLPAWKVSCLGWSRDRLAELRRGELRDHRDITLSALAVGEARFAFIPFETFTETGRAVRAGAPGPVLVAACADGIFGYLPIESAYAEGGYEVADAHRFYDVLPPAPGSAEEIAQALRKLL